MIGIELNEYSYIRGRCWYLQLYCVMIPNYGGGIFKTNFSDGELKTFFWMFLETTFSSSVVCNFIKEMCLCVIPCIIFNSSSDRKFRWAYRCSQKHLENCNNNSINIRSPHRRKILFSNGFTSRIGIIFWKSKDFLAITLESQHPLTSTDHSVWFEIKQIPPPTNWYHPI